MPYVDESDFEDYMAWKRARSESAHATEDDDSDPLDFADKAEWEEHVRKTINTRTYETAVAKAETPEELREVQERFGVLEPKRYYPTKATTDAEAPDMSPEADAAIRNARNSEELDELLERFNRKSVATR